VKKDKWGNSYPGVKRAVAGRYRTELMQTRWHLFTSQDGAKSRSGQESSGEPVKKKNQTKSLHAGTKRGKKTGGSKTAWGSIVGGKRKLTKANGGV